MGVEAKKELNDISNEVLLSMEILHDGTVGIIIPFHMKRECKHYRGIILIKYPGEDFAHVY